ncbi:MAG: PQQ-dependent sugar dehydrogenase [Acidimicrobiia bacterium]
MHAGVVALTATLALVGCSNSTSKNAQPTLKTATTAPPTTSAPNGAPNVPLQSINLELEPVATLSAVTGFATRANDRSLYVAEQRGSVRRMTGTEVDPAPVLDIARDVRNEGERGLLGLAFSPDGSKLYVHFSDRNGDTRIDEFAMRDATADPNQRRTVLSQKQPFSNHNGGQLAFGPDGFLYIALGDGGSRGDPQGNAQNLATMLGKILRIDPTADGTKPYRIPGDNPFVRTDGARPEVFAYGLRNPWRFSFDTDGSLWIGDVGQNEWEEIDVLPAGKAAGANLGWNAFEGRSRFKGSPPANAVAPVLVYANPARGCSVIGGGVYRGTAIPALAGTYLYSDYCAGELRGLKVDESGATRDEWSWAAAKSDAVTTVGRGPDDEWYVGTGTGAVFRVAPA